MKLSNRILLYGTLALFVLLSAAQSGLGRETPADTASKENNKGIVVDTVRKNFEAEKEGLKEGDILLHWSRGDASGDLESPFDLPDIEIEQAPRGTVSVDGLRDGAKQTWVLGSTRWGMDVRPNLTETLLRIYLEGQNLATANKIQDAAERWRLAAEKEREVQPPWLSSWFLSHAGQALADARQWKEAGALYEEAIQGSAGAGKEIKRQLLRQWADKLQERADWANATKFYQEALSGQPTSGQGSLMLADILNGLGRCFFKSGDLEKGNTYYSQALEIEQRLAPDGLGVAKSLFGLGALAEDRGDLNQAEKDFIQALTIQKKVVPDSLDVAGTLNALGVVAIDRGNLSQAEDYYLQALAIRKKVGPGSLSVAASLNNLGNLADARGELARAEEFHRQSLAIKRELAPGSLDVAVALINLGKIAWERGDFALAEEYERESLAIQKRLAPDSLDFANTLNNLADVIRDRGDLQQAEKYHSQALALAEKLAPGSAIAGDSFNALARIAYERGDTARAEEYFHKALAIREKLTPDGYDVAKSLYGLGLTAHARGDLDKSETYFRQVMGILQKQMPDSVGVAQNLYELGSIARDRGDLDKAEDIYRRGIAISQIIDARNKQYSEALAALAAILVRKQQLDAAAPFFEQAVNVLENRISHLGGSEDIRSNFRAQNAEVYRNYVDLLIRLKQPELALQVLERSRAQTLLEMLAVAHMNVHRGVDAALLEREHSLQADIRAKVDRRIRLISAKHTEEQITTINQEIAALLTQHDEVEGQIRSSSPSYAALTQPQPLSAKEIQQLVDAETVLLEYSLGKERSYVFAVTANSIDVHELPKRAEIEVAARRVYESLTTRNHKTKEETRPHSPVLSASFSEKVASEHSQASATLSRMILAPVARQIKGRRLLIVSDGALQYIPFAVLPEPETAVAHETIAKIQPLLVEHEIVNLPSASVLATLRRERIGRKEAVKAVAVLADPVFAKNDGRIRTIATVQTPGGGITRGINDNESSIDKSKEESPSTESFSGNHLTRSVADVGLSADGAYLPRLRFTRREAEAIMAATPAGEGMKALDFAASRSMASSPELAQYRVVHFATHGLLDNEHPELSGLVFSLVDEKGKPQNGFLELEDIYNLNLPVELVVLSACETGLGKDIQGEGLVGLTRGFIYAGASRVLASLWKVDDVATAELMGRFYKAMEKENMRPAAALRKAQIEMWKQKDWSSPYYWAAFQIQGEWK